VRFSFGNVKVTAPNQMDTVCVQALTFVYWSKTALVKVLCGDCIVIMQSPLIRPKIWSIWWVQWYV